MPNLPTHLSLAINSEKRFEALLKQEMREHQHLIACHHKEMQELRNSLKLAMEKFDSLFQKYEQELKDFKIYAIGLIDIQKEKLDAQEFVISEMKRTIDSFHALLMNMHSFYTSHSDMEDFKQSLQFRLDSETQRHLSSFQGMERQVKDLIFSLTKDVDQRKNEIETRFCKVDEVAEKNFNACRLEKEGIEKDFIRYKKAMFYIEKKIENIYTLIERINKKEGKDICHKPE